MIRCSGAVRCTRIVGADTGIEAGDAGLRTIGRTGEPVGHPAAEAGSVEDDLAVWSARGGMSCGRRWCWGGHGWRRSFRLVRHGRTRRWRNRPGGPGSELEIGGRGRPLGRRRRGGPWRGGGCNGCWTGRFAGGWGCRWRGDDGLGAGRIDIRNPDGDWCNGYRIGPIGRGDRAKDGRCVIRFGRLRRCGRDYRWRRRGLLGRGNTQDRW